MIYELEMIAWRLWMWCFSDWGWSQPCCVVLVSIAIATVLVCIGQQPFDYTDDWKGDVKGEVKTIECSWKDVSRQLRRVAR